MNQMINAIIFSKDRAAQLRLFLHSIQKNSPNVFKLNVIYKYSNDSFREGYEKVKDEFSNLCNFVEQTSDFKNDVIKLLDSDSDLSCFFTDDDIIYKTFDYEKVKTTIESDEDIFCFSLRLGKNTTFCYTMNTPNVFRDYEELDGVLKWDWSVHYIDFGYPLSVDGHVFHTRDILKLTKKVMFQDPNTFEAALQIFDYFPKNKMAAFSESVLVNTPNNIVNTSIKNLSGLKYAASPEILNKEFLEGKLIDIDSMDFSEIKGCHQEIEFKYS